MWQTTASHLIWFYIPLSGLFTYLFIYFWYLGNGLTWNTPIERITLSPTLNHGSLNFTLPSYHQTVWSLTQIRHKILGVSTLSDLDATTLQDLHIGFLLKLYTRHGSFKCACFTPQLIDLFATQPCCRRATPKFVPTQPALVSVW